MYNSKNELEYERYSMCHIANVGKGHHMTIGRQIERFNGMGSYSRRAGQGPKPLQVMSVLLGKLVYETGISLLVSG